MSIEDVLEDIEPDQRTVRICLRGAISDQIASLEAELVAIGSVDTLGPTGRQEIAEQIAALQTEAEAHTHDFVCQSIGSQAWRRLLGQHAPTREQRKEGFDHNPDTFQSVAIARCVVSPAMTEEQAKQLEERLSDGQWARLWITVKDVNTDGGDLPKSELATAILRASRPSSTTAVREESPEASS